MSTFLYIVCYFLLLLQYTHIIIEFWGMLKFDCMKELSWSHGFKKEQILPLIREANDLGLEIIPMFNHWGHASASRVMHGKHVVLDQDPSLYPLFTPDGWSWNIDNPNPLALLRQVRAELYELSVLCDNVCDHIGNYTRFICISKDLEIYPGSDKTTVMMVSSVVMAFAKPILKGDTNNDSEISAVDARNILLEEIEHEQDLQDLQEDLEDIDRICKTADKERLLRSLNREEKPDCQEICRRFLADKKDFADENIEFDFLQYYNKDNTPFDKTFWANIIKEK